MRVRGCEDPEGTKLYLEDFPEGRYATEADGCYWKGVRGCEDPEGTRKYLELLPEGSHATEARGCIAWEEVRGCEDKRAVEEFLGNNPESRHTEKARACLARLESRDRVDALVEELLAECRVHHESHRLTVGAGGTAFECYRRVLEEDPGNADALSGIAEIARYYVGRARSALGGSRPDDVLKWVERLELVSPEHPRVEGEFRVGAEELRRRLAELSPGRVFRDCPECPEMVVVRRGRS